MELDTDDFYMTPIRRTTMAKKRKKSPNRAAVTRKAKSTLAKIRKKKSSRRTATAGRSDKRADRSVHARRLPHRDWTKENRLDSYAQVSHMAIRYGETDQLVRNLMGAGLARGESGGDLLAQDLTLLRWVLKKMQANRATAAMIADYDRESEAMEPLRDDC